MRVPHFPDIRPYSPPVPTYWGRETTSRPISNSQTSAQLVCTVHTSYAPVSGTLSPFPELSASGNVTFHGAQSTTLLGLSAASPRRATGPHLRCGRWHLSSMRLKRVTRLKRNGWQARVHSFPREGIFRFLKIQGKGYAGFRRYFPYGLHAPYGGGAKRGFEPKFWLLPL